MSSFRAALLLSPMASSLVGASDEEEEEEEGEEEGMEDEELEQQEQQQQEQQLQGRKEGATGLREGGDKGGQARKARALQSLILRAAWVWLVMGGGMSIFYAFIQERKEGGREGWVGIPLGRQALELVGAALLRQWLLGTVTKSRWLRSVAWRWTCLLTASMLLGLLFCVYAAPRILVEGGGREGGGGRAVVGVVCEARPGGEALALAKADEIKRWMRRWDGWSWPLCLWLWLEWRRERRRRERQRVALLVKERTEGMERIEQVEN